MAVHLPRDFALYLRQSGAQCRDQPVPQELSGAGRWVPYTPPRYPGDRLQQSPQS